MNKLLIKSCRNDKFIVVGVSIWLYCSFKLSYNIISFYREYKVSEIYGEKQGFTPPIYDFLTFVCLYLTLDDLANSKRL